MILQARTTGNSENLSIFTEKIRKRFLKPSMASKSLLIRSMRSLTSGQKGLMARSTMAENNLAPMLATLECTQR